LVTAESIGKSARFFRRKASRDAAPLLAFMAYWPDIHHGRLAVDEPLANRVRSGRKQP
jgi:hypothetical protein